MLLGEESIFLDFLSYLQHKKDVANGQLIIV